MTAYISPIANGQHFDADGVPLVGGKVYTYAAGTTTPIDAYTTHAGDIAQSNPAILNTLGALDNPLYLDQGVGYKIVIKDADDVATGLEYDDVYGVEESTAPSEWVLYTGAFSYLSSTTFSVVGDQTQVFQTNRHLKTLVTAGTAYHTVVSASYSAPDTTVTVTNTFLALDTGLNQLYYGFFAPNNSSIPESVIGGQIRTATDQATAQAALGVYSESEVDDAIAAAVDDVPVPKQIQVITAVPTSNTLVVSSEATRLEFRSATQSSGAVTAVDVPALTLTVPNGATLGTISTKEAVLQYGILLNGSTPEPFIYNASHGNNVLNEEGLITTTALNTSSDSEDGIYSVTARTDVPYRIIGSTTLTQATAGTWVTDPTKIQGVGGLALLKDAKYTYNTETGNRTSGTTYYNTYGREIIVMVYGTQVNSTSSLTVAVDGSTRLISSGFDGNGGQFRPSVTFPVPEGSSYSVTAVGSTISNWQEYR